MSKKMHDIFGPGSNFEGRVFRDYGQLSEKIASWLGLDNDSIDYLKRTN